MHVMEHRTMKRILCFGDSNTWGYDSRSFFGDQYPFDVRWTGLLSKSGFEVLNFGQNGMCVPEGTSLRWVLDLARDNLPADAVTVMLGSNDLLRNDQAHEIRSHMRVLIQGLKELLPSEMILLTAPPILKPGIWVSSPASIRESEKLAEEYRMLAEEEQTAYADASKWGIEVLSDGVHFSPSGHAVFAERLMEKLNEITGTEE